VGARNGLLAWRYAGGKEVRGLLLRREFERKVCLGEAKLGGVAIDGQNYRYRDAHV
jgi:hypothetical protein